MACGGPLAAVGRSGLESRQETPKLVVLMVVDQMRGDFLEHYGPAFTGGFRRLMDRGYTFTRATHNHARTSTGPGHTTLATGVHPTRHGIVGNSWTEIRDGVPVQVYNVEDEDSPILGYPEFYGRSPKNSYREGLADWIRDQDDDARIASISLKDRAAIGLASKAKGDVFWILLDDGHFATSEYYFDDYPKWVERFNEEVMPGLYSDTIWESEIPEHLEYLSRPDTSRYEIDGIHSYFPHLTRAELTSEGDRAWMDWRSQLSPFPDRAVLAMAREAIRERRLGQRGEVDYLGISLSQTDKIGHRYGPMSREQLDNLIRLDRELEEFFRFLDETVGVDRWVMAFSSDHGVSDVQEYLPEPVPRFGSEMQSRLNEALREAVSGGGAPDDVRNRMVSRFKELDFIEDAWSVRELQSGNPADSFAVLYRNSLSTERFWGLLGRFQIHVRWIPGLKPGYLRGTNHETPYYSDRWVPLIFYGSGVTAGSSDRPVASIDVAPTLASLAGIPVPADLDGVTLIP